MLSERIDVYNKLKDDKEKLYSYKYKTEKEYKEEFEFLKLGSSRALQQTRGDLNTAYGNYFRKGIKNGFKLKGGVLDRLKKGTLGRETRNTDIENHPQFKSKKKSKNSYREPQVDNAIQIKDNKLKLLKLGWVSFKGLSKSFNGIIKNVTVTKSKSNKYFASILVEKEYKDIKIRRKNDIIGVDLGIKEFAICSNGDIIKGIKSELLLIEKKIKKQHRHLSRKIECNKKHNIKKSNRQSKCEAKLNRLYEYKTNYKNHFQWTLINKLCQDNQLIVLEDLNVSGMIKNRKLSHAIQLSNWSDFVSKLEQKAKEYGTEVVKISRWHPSSKTCSKCGNIKKDLTLSDRTYICNECGFEMDRDLNAAINIKNYFLNNSSMEYIDYSRGEIVRPKELFYNSKGSFYEAIKNEISECNIC